VYLQFVAFITCPWLTQRTYKVDTFYPRDVISAVHVYATATWLAGWDGGWLAGWLSVTADIVSKMTKPILKLFRPYGSPII